MYTNVTTVYLAVSQLAEENKLIIINSVVYVIR